MVLEGVLPGMAFALCLLCFMGTAVALEPIHPLPRNPQYDRDKAELGKRLFFDRRLSADGKIACASCHDPRHGGAEPRASSTGVFWRKGRLNAPTVFNAVYNFRQFWNGRAGTLKDQLKGPMHNPVEMDMRPAQVVARVSADADYRRSFRRIYGDRPLRLEQVVDAIVEFEKALVTPDSRLDLYLRGERELDPAALSGYRLFKRLGCITCHNGINIGGNSFQYFGAVIPYNGASLNGDRFGLTGDPFDRHRYKVPSLRNVLLTAPYLHDGSESDLEKLVDIMAYHNIGLQLSDDERASIMAFFGALTGKRPEILGAP